MVSLPQFQQLLHGFDPLRGELLGIRDIQDAAIIVQDMEVAAELFGVKIVSGLCALGGGNTGLYIHNMIDKAVLLRAADHDGLLHEHIHLH